MNGASFITSTAGDAVSQKYAVLCFAPPIVSELRLVYHYPPYTQGLPDRKSSEGDIVAPVGTRVDIEAFCSNPLRRAWIALDGMERPLALDDAGRHACARNDRRRRRRDVRHPFP